MVCFKVERLCGEQRSQAGDERVAWGQWLTSACLAVPAQSFRLFQRDTFEATMRYLPQMPHAEATRLPPPPVQVYSASQHTFQPAHPSQQDQPQSHISMLHDMEPLPTQAQPNSLMVRVI